MAPSWMSRALPRIQTDPRDLGHSKQYVHSFRRACSILRSYSLDDSTRRRQCELQEGTSTSSSSRNSSFLVTPSSSRPSHSPLSPRHHDESCCVSNELHHPGASSTLTIQPFRAAAGLADDGAIALSKRCEIRHS
jgi:hypothetical protein